MPTAVEFRLVCPLLISFSAALAELLRVKLGLDWALGMAASTAPK